MPVPSLLGVFAHPDDESLSAGGVLARHAAAGARTAVVTATWAPDTPDGTNRLTARCGERGLTDRHWGGYDAGDEELLLVRIGGIVRTG